MLWTKNTRYKKNFKNSILHKEVAGVFLKTLKVHFMQLYYFYYSLGTELYIRKQIFFLELCFHFLCVFFGGKYVLLFTADICFVAAKHFSATLNQKASLVFRRQKEPRQESQLMVFFQMKFTNKTILYIFYKTKRGP